MGRKGNSGPYAPENVECVTKEQKQKSQLIALSVSAFSPERLERQPKRLALFEAAIKTGRQELLSRL